MFTRLALGFALVLAAAALGLPGSASADYRSPAPIARTASIDYAAYVVRRGPYYGRTVVRYRAPYYGRTVVRRGPYYGRTVVRYRAPYYGRTVVRRGPFYGRTVVRRRVY